jgi:2-hydroxychromene-2-carboxylate isomerase
MTLQAELYLSIRNPNSYLVAWQYRKMAEDHDLEIRVKPVYPLAIRNPGYFEQASPLWVPYLIKDCKRYAEFHGQTFALPQPDPIVQNLETLEIADDQPYIYRLTRLAMEAVSRGQGLAFSHELLHLIWSGDVGNWNEADHLAQCAERAGLVLAELDASILENAGALDDEIFKNQDDLQDDGHWYTPSFVFGGELFFGESRVDLALWRLKQNGLQLRS